MNRTIKKLYFLMIGIGILIPGIVEGQPIFSRKVRLGLPGTIPELCIANAVTETDSCGYLIGGFDVQVGSSIKLTPFLASFAYNGTTRGAYLISGLTLTTLPFVTAVTALPDSRYAIAGYHTNLNFRGDSIFVAQLDSALDTIWARRFPAKASELRVAKVIPASGGGLITAGVVNVDGSEDLLIARFGDQGTLKWSSRLVLPDYEELARIHHTLDGGLIITGTKSKSGLHEKDGLLIKLDTLGNMLWGYSFGQDSLDGFLDLIQLPDSTFLVCGMAQDSTALLDPDAMIARLDQHGGLLWARRYPAPGPQLLSSVGVNAAGNIQVFGLWTLQQGLSVDTLPWMMELEPNGKVLSSQLLTSLNSGLMAEMIQSRDSGWILTYNDPYDLDLGILSLNTQKLFSLQRLGREGQSICQIPTDSIDSVHHELIVLPVQDSVVRDSSWRVDNLSINVKPGINADTLCRDTCRSPTLKLDIPDSSACEGETLTFISWINCPAENAFWRVAYDTLPYSGDTLQYTFSYRGNYLLELVAKNGDCETRISTRIRVDPQPKVDIEWFKYGPRVRFFSASLDDTRWHWDFGDGTTDTIKNPVHNFSTSDHYSFNLIAGNANCQDSVTYSDTVCSAGAQLPAGTLDVKYNGKSSVEFQPNVQHATKVRIWGEDRNSFEFNGMGGGKHEYDDLCCEGNKVWMIAENECGTLNFETTVRGNYIKNPPPKRIRVHSMYVPQSWEQDKLEMPLDSNQNRISDILENPGTYDILIYLNQPLNEADIDTHFSRFTQSGVPAMLGTYLPVVALTDVVDSNVVAISLDSVVSYIDQDWKEQVMCLDTALLVQGVQDYGWRSGQSVRSLYPTLNGESFTLAIFDTGVNTHYLAENDSSLIAFQYDAIRNRYEAVPDSSGHGTIISALALGRGFGGNFFGVAPRASLAAIKVANKDGEVQMRDVIRGIETVIDRNQDYNIKTILLPFSYQLQGNGQDVLSQYVNQAHEFGISVVVAAGNHGTDGVGIPGLAREAITVANGMPDPQNWWNPSMAGPGLNTPTGGYLRDSAGYYWKPELTAIGSDLSMIEVVSGSGTGWPSREIFSGTSAAAANVAGLVLLLYDQEDETYPSSIKEILQNTAVPLSGSLPDVFTGFGLIDALAAVQLRDTCPKADLELKDATNVSLKKSIQSSSIWFQNEQIEPGKLNAIFVEVFNIGKEKSRFAQLRIEAYPMSNAGSGHLLDTLRLPPIDTGASYTVKIPWTPKESRKRKNCPEIPEYCVKAEVICDCDEDYQNNWTQHNRVAKEADPSSSYRAQVQNPRGEEVKALIEACNPAPDLWDTKVNPPQINMSRGEQECFELEVIRLPEEDCLPCDGKQFKRGYGIRHDNPDTLTKVDSIGPCTPQNPCYPLPKCVTYDSTYINSIDIEVIVHFKDSLCEKEDAIMVANAEVLCNGSPDLNASLTGAAAFIGTTYYTNVGDTITLVLTTINASQAFIFHPNIGGNIKYQATDSITFVVSNFSFGEYFLGVSGICGCTTKKLKLENCPCRYPNASLSVIMDTQNWSYMIDVLNKNAGCIYRVHVGDSIYTNFPVKHVPVNQSKPDTFYLFQKDVCNGTHLIDSTVFRGSNQSTPPNYLGLYDFSVIPNPNPGTFYLHYNGKVLRDRLDIQVFNLHGISVHEQIFRPSPDSNPIMISTRMLPKGVYILQVRARNTIWLQRILIL